MASGFILTATIFLPLIFAAIIFVLPKDNIGRIKVITLSGSAATFLVSLFLFFGYDSAIGGFQFQQKFAWIENLNISYFVGIDGMPLLLF